MIKMKNKNVVSITIDVEVSDEKLLPVIRKILEMTKESEPKGSTKDEIHV